MGESEGVKAVLIGGRGDGKKIQDVKPDLVTLCTHGQWYFRSVPLDEEHNRRLAGTMPFYSIEALNTIAGRFAKDENKNDE